MSNSQQVVSVLGWIGNAGGLTTATLMRMSELSRLDAAHEYVIKTYSIQTMYKTQLNEAIQKVNKVSGVSPLTYVNPFIEARFSDVKRNFMYYVNQHLHTYSQKGNVYFDSSEDNNIRYFYEKSGKISPLVTIISGANPTSAWLFDPKSGIALSKLEMDENGTVVIITYRDTTTNKPTSRAFLKENGDVLFTSYYRDNGSEVFKYQNQEFKTHYDVLVRLDTNYDPEQILFLDESRISIDVFKNGGQSYKKLIVMGHRPDYVHWSTSYYGVPPKSALKPEWKKYYEIMEQEENIEYNSLTPLNYDFVKSVYPKVAEKTHVIGNLIPKPLIDESVILEAPINENRIAFIGRIHEGEKRITDILKSFAKLLAYKPAAELYFIGNFNDAQSKKLFYDTIAELNIGKSVHTTGYVSNVSEKLLELNISTAITISRMETFSMVVPEALQLGIKYLIVDTPYWSSLWRTFEGVKLAEISADPNNMNQIIADNLNELLDTTYTRKEIMDSYVESYKNLDYVNKYLNVINAN